MEHTYTVALAGNPNVGKSTVFNRLTGLRQHTGNWPGKTVERAEGYFSQAGQRFRLVDLPGTYSLAADSPEEEVAGAFLQSGQADAVIVVVDASCLRRGLILALQLRQQTQRLVLCVNLMDEAARRGITPQTERLGQLLDVPVVATAARSGKGLAELRHQAAEVCRREPWEDGWKLTYAPPVEAALGLLETGMSRRRAVALLWGSPPTEGEQSLWQRAQQRLGALSGQALRDSLTASVVALAEEKGIETLFLAEDADVTFGESALRIYAPLGSGGANEEGLSVLCTAGDFDGLITGDMNDTVEKRLVKYGSLPDLELLVAGHHGSKYATSEELLLATRPELAVISVGYNTYGHPAPETLERLAAAGCAIYRTDWSGTVTITAK